MKHLFSRLPKKALLAAVLVAGVFGIAAIAHAFSPERPTYTTAVPADHVTFNSITDNPREGDERAFFSVKDAANTASDGFLHQTTVKDGEEVLLRVYVHNNAADNLNGANLDGKGVAKNTQVRVWLPSVTDTTLRANAYVSADNATPQVVADTADLIAPTTSNKFSISYVPGSAIAYNNAVGQTGLKLSDSIVTTGALLGEAQADGIVPGCFNFVNVVTLKVKVHMATPSFSIAKTVALPGDKTWSKSVTAQPGQAVNYQLAFQNTGNATLNDVVLRDQLPAGVSIVSGSAKLFNGSFPSGGAQSDAIVANGGQNIGSYGTTSNAYFQFKATMPTADKLQCGNNTLTNTAQAIVNGQDSTDTATVTITKTCNETKNPVYSCNLLTVTKGDNRTINASVAYTATNGATLKTVTYNFGDNSTPLTTDKTTTSYQYKADGTYAVTATLTFSVNGADVTGVTSNTCAQSVSFTTPSTPVTPPTALPNTGAGNVIGIFAGSVVAGAIGYRLFMSRKLAR